MKWLVPIVLLLAGCGSNTAWQASVGTPPPSSAAGLHIEGGSGLATAFGLAIFAAAAYEAARTDLELQNSRGPGYRGRNPPEMAPERKVSEQDCTKPIDFSLGNLRCK